MEYMNIKIEEYVELKEMTTMRVGGNARFFVRVATVDDLEETFLWIKEKGIPFFVLGGGSNTLILDDGFDGIVIKMELHGIEYEETETRVCVTAFAGEMWDSVVEDVVRRNLWGIENLSLIPGMVGGAFVQNIGAYGAEVCEYVAWVEAFNTHTMETQRFLNDECKFGYRESVFKKNPHLIVLRGAINLSRVPNMRIDYEDLKKYFEEEHIDSPTLKQIRNAVVSIRTEKMPPPPLGTAGSFFKNPVISEERFKKLIQEFPHIKSYPHENNTVKISAAFLLDKIGGWRGVRRGDVGVYEKQALILVNHGNAKARDIISLAQEIKKSIHEKINIELEEEVVMMSARK